MKRRKTIRSWVNLNGFGIWFGIALIAGPPVNATEVPKSIETAAAPAPSTSMHGISLSDYGDFEKKWKLVTVRFRKDTGELRFTYANEKAWKHLKNISTEVGKSQKSESKSYPPGAVFAKVGIATDDDPAFVSSAVPSGVRRVQFMVRDEKKFSETDGWGYALFDSGGRTFPGDLKQASLACAACHKLVPDRGYVFSQFMTGLAPKARAESAVGGRIKFEDVEVSTLPGHVRIHLPPKVGKVRSIVGEITKQVFPGTLDELRPVLTREALKWGYPALFLSAKSGSAHYSVVYSTMLQGTCSPGKIEMLGVMNTSENPETAQSIRFCEGDKR